MEPGAERTKAILEIARELGRLRRGDHQRRRVVLEEAKWERELDEKFEAECEEIRRKTEWENLRTKVEAEQARERYEREQKAGTLNPQWAAKVEGFFATHGEQLRKLGVAELPVDNRPPEQRQGQAPSQGQGGVGGGSGYGTGGGSIPQHSTQSESK